MASKRKDFGSSDVISSLPDALICHILSFLSTKNAALTSVLAKRWRYLLAFVPNLDLSNTPYDKPRICRQKRQQMQINFKDFVNRVMALQGNASLNKVSLRYKFRSDPSHVNGWILNVLERGVSDLDVYIYKDYDYTLPPKVLMTKTLVKLKLQGTDNFIINVEEVCLPKLKTLCLHHVEFDESGAAFAKLMSGCPVLEEFVMIDVICYRWESFSISKPTLKRLTVFCSIVMNSPKSVLFDTPNLVYLQYSDAVAVKYPKVSFDSLVEANLGLRRIFNRNEYATKFIMGLGNVRILYLTSDTIQVLNRRCKAIPVFNNLIHLTIETHQELKWESLPNLLENCPNLETLVFERLQYQDTNQCGDQDYSFKDTSKCADGSESICMCKPWEGTPICISASPVKILKVLKFGEISFRKDDIEKQTELIKHFLETMPNLEEVVLYYDTPFDDDLYIVSTELQMLKKVASPKCKIQLISDKISVSSTLHSSTSSSELVFFKNVFPV